jgi:putative FmdB family regulatory protein
MPTYEYGCAACGHEWDEIQRITAPPIEVCPKCSKSAAHRLISKGTGFILKGGGWYSDLYSSSKSTGKKEGDKSGSSGDSAGKASEPASKPEGTKDGGGKTESKAAAAPSTTSSTTSGS